MEFPVQNKSTELPWWLWKGIFQKALMAIGRQLPRLCPGRSVCRSPHGEGPHGEGHWLFSAIQPKNVLCRRAFPHLKLAKYLHLSVLSENKGAKRMSCFVLEQEWPTVTLWMQEESQILHSCRRPGETGAKASRSISAEPLQLRDTVVKGGLRDLGAHMLLHQPNPRLEKQQLLVGRHSPWGIPWEPMSTSNFMLCQAGGAPGAPLSSWKPFTHNFWPAAHERESFRLPNRWIYFCPGIFWPFCSSRTHNHTHDSSPQGNSTSPSVGVPILTTQYDAFRAHPQLFMPSPADNLLLSGAQELRKSDWMAPTPAERRERRSLGLPHLLSGGAASTMQRLLPTPSTAKAYVTSQKAWHFQTPFFLYAFCFLSR